MTGGTSDVLSLDSAEMKAFSTRGYQQEMLDCSLHTNIIIALDTGSGKTHIAVLRMKIEAEREPNKISWFLAPTVALCEQQRLVIQTALPVSVGLISGALEPEQWKNAALWRSVLTTHRIMVTTPQVLLDALRHGYINLGQDIGLLIFDEAHHAVDNHPYNRIMTEFYFDCSPRPVGPSGGSTGEGVRPMVLGLTASPIFGGNVASAFRTIEKNLDSVIRSPRRQREELAQFVHRPVFKHVLYRPDPEPFSTNLAAFDFVLQSLDIDQDPWVVSTRKKLAKMTPGTPDYNRLDQKLSKTILKQNSYTHAALQQVSRAAAEICSDLGSWAADWYIWKVLQQAKAATNPYQNVVSDLSHLERGYLASILDRIVVTAVSYSDDDIIDESSDKVRVLVECLLAEKADTESHNESYSGLIFVRRRDAVLALAEVLSHHPMTKNLFTIGCLVGGAESVYRNSILDITRSLLKFQDDTLMDFKIGEKNLIVSTAVAEEGIDIQACGSVIRWDPPENMASWAQSRGRARRERSTFTLMFEDDGAHEKVVADWEKLEREMVALYNDPSRDLRHVREDSDHLMDDDDELEFRVESTGALLTLHSAVSHLNHFCAVIPNTGHVDHRPLFDIDPPEMPEGWHSFEKRSTGIRPYMGPYGAKVTLPRLLPSKLRYFETERVHPNKLSAMRHAAFYAYRALYENGLLNESLLPLTSVVEPELEEEVKALLQEVEKRSGTARVSVQMDPWAPIDISDPWCASELTIPGLPPLLLFTRSKPPTSCSMEDAPVLHRPRSQDSVTLQPTKLEVSPEMIAGAREYTRRIFWCINGSRMVWDDTNFSYLFLPPDGAHETAWDARRLWHIEQNLNADPFFTNALSFGNHFSFPSDLAIIRNGPQFSKAFRFVRWRSEPLSPEEEAEFRATYPRFPDLEIEYPLLVVEYLPPRTNFLIPLPKNYDPAAPKTINLLPRLCWVTLCSEIEAQYAFLLPSVLRSLAMSMTMNSLRDTLFSALPLYTVPLALLRTALSAPASQERSNYQRLETLGDTVLKFTSTIQLLGEYPLWHEGYLTQKMGHCVSNVRLAKANIGHSLYRWIIRDRMLGKKWGPSYFTVRSNTQTCTDVEEDLDVDMNKRKKKKSKSQDLSTKVLADVVESLIGAVYLHGNFDLALVCARFFDLGIKWEPLPSRIDAMLSRAETHSELPTQLELVENMLGYTFTHKMLLVEALTHASYQQDLRTISYERLEFCGDAVLDMIVTEYLYRAEGKDYSPGHMFHRKSATVNAHILAFICLGTYIEVDASMPRPTGNHGHGNIKLQTDSQRIYLWQCLLHSSPRVLDDQRSTFTRYTKRQAEIEEALHHGGIFPWAALTRMQAPKFLSDMIESLLGAVFLDSRGSLDTVRNVLHALGLFQILERIVWDDIDVLHPVSRLHMWASKKAHKLDFSFEQTKGDISCAVALDGEVVEESRVADQYKGRLTKDEVRLASAEKAIKLFRLRDVNTSYTTLKRKVRSKSRKRKLSVSSL
ncbi:hypothetical protein B0H10DRAFT_2025133 [Mycena sp. CBHHK59/15]|nr:hypothetical protein B0H10DRAFT_2025133 [Mycena sp. CBHHK59/15]